jgi:putative salt-induced outer membrane protein YdiY
MQIRPLAGLAAVATALVAPLLANAQVTQKPDGQWRSLFTAGASVASGNTDAKSASLGADLIKLTDMDKWSLTGSGQYARSAGATTANRQAGTGQYARNMTPEWFGFGELDLLRDLPSDLALRTTLASGIGYHVVKKPDQTFDLSAGFAYTMDRYRHSQLIADETRDRYDHAELLLAEESNNKLTASTSFKQKLTVYPNLRNTGEMRAVFDAGLSAAMTKQLALTATLSHRYDSRPGTGLKRNDTLFVTGVSLRFD